jgi:hypothetical protein
MVFNFENNDLVLFVLVILLILSCDNSLWFYLCT